MNENINLAEILKDCPKGTKLYSPVYGELYLIRVLGGSTFSIRLMTKLNVQVSFMSNGFEYSYNAECLLFPSKDVRTWEGWQCPKPKKPKFDPKTLKAFERVLAFDNIDKVWSCDFYSHKANEQECFNPEFPYICVGNTTDRIIPYNDDTKHLVGTSDEALEYYRYWEE